MGSDIRPILRMANPDPISTSSVIEANDQGYSFLRIAVMPALAGGAKPHLASRPRQSVACPLNSSISLGVMKG